MGNAIASRDLLSVGQCAALLGVSIQTVRNYCESGELNAFRIGTGNHRRISKGSALNYLHGGALESSTGKVLAYARTSSLKQRADLERQIERLKEYAKGHYADKELVLFKDNSSSNNWSRPGLVKLLTEIMAGQHKGTTLLITSLDRLGRHCREILLLICKQFEVNVIYTEQDDEKSLDVLMSEELLQIVHLYSVRMYGLKSGSRKKLMPEANAIARGKELQAQGQSSRKITELLISEGFKCDNGKEITHAAVRNHIFDPKVAWRLPTESKETSAEEFKRAYARKVAPCYRIKIADCYDYYLGWCKENEKLPVSKIRFSIVFNSEYEKGFLDTHHAWVGLEIRGENFHRKVREHGSKHRPETSSERFGRFIMGLGQFKGRLKDIQQRYWAFCKEEKVEMVGERELSRLLRGPKIKVVKTAAGYVYHLNGA